MGLRAGSPAIVRHFGGLLLSKALNYVLGRGVVNFKLRRCVLDGHAVFVDEFY